MSKSNNKNKIMNKCNKNKEKTIIRIGIKWIIWIRGIR